MAVAAPDLWSIKFSPWSVRTRWALRLLNYDFKEVQYNEKTFKEFSLRSALSKWSGIVQCPALVSPDKRIMGSLEIVQHAQATQIGSQASTTGLLVSGVEEWIPICDDIMELERSRSLAMLLSSKEALRMAAPPSMNGLLKSPLAPVGDWMLRKIVTGLSQKYNREYNDQELIAALEKLEAGLKASKSGYLLGRFTYADVCAVCALETVSSTPGHHIHNAFPPHTDLDYALDNLIVWKDGIMAKHWDAQFPNGV